MQRSDIAATTCRAKAIAATTVATTSISGDLNVVRGRSCGGDIACIATHAARQRTLVPDQVGIRVVLTELRHVRAASKLPRDGELGLLVRSEVFAISVGIQVRSLHVELAEAAAELAGLFDLHSNGCVVAVVDEIGT